ncbi:MAG: hypothetical protein QOJ27_569 [Sphingomonadales bacterium]|nr:hypothetical protein [Sphingomonadales bacterium]
MKPTPFTLALCAAFAGCAPAPAGPDAPAPEAHLPSPAAILPPPPPALPAPAGMAGGGLAAADPDAVEALYRHQIGDNASGGQLNVALLCLAVGPAIGRLGDPPHGLLARFGGHRPPVRGYSSCLWKDDRWTDAATGGNAIVHYIVRFDCRSPDRCTAAGGYLEGNLSSSGNRYEVERRGGRWQVTSDVMEWIS